MEIQTGTPPDAKMKREQGGDVGRRRTRPELRACYSKLP